MTVLAVVLLAVIQGLTEFLPVSSSGHLALGGIVLNLPGENIAFDVVVHMGTLMAVLAVYWKDIVQLAAGVLKRDRESLLLASMLAIASVPAAIAGLLLKDRISAMFTDPALVSAMLIVTGTVLYSTRFTGSGGRPRPGIMGSLIVGVSQALALVPGISRSGMTISSGLFVGISREKAARFSFLLSVPAIAGAGVLEIGDAGSSGLGLPLMALGFVISAITGYAALRLLLKFLRAGKFSVFSWYCWLLGIIGLTLSLMGG